MFLQKKKASFTSWNVVSMKSKKKHLVRLLSDLSDYILIRFSKQSQGASALQVKILFIPSADSVNPMSVKVLFPVIYQLLFAHNRK